MDIPTSEPKTGPKARILIVDDEVLVRSMISAVVESMGLEAIQVGTGQEALDWARTQQPALVLLDLAMPGLSGIDVCRHLREDARTRDVAVIVITGLDERAAWEASVIAGADDFLHKPFSNAELSVRVRSMLSVLHIPDKWRRIEAYIQNLQASRKL